MNLDPYFLHFAADPLNESKLLISRGAADLLTARWAIGSPVSGGGGDGASTGVV